MEDGKVRFEKYLIDSPPVNKQALLRACFSLQKFRLLLGDTEINVFLEVNQAHADYIVSTLTRAGVKEIKQSWQSQIEITNGIQGISLKNCINKTGQIQHGDSIKKVEQSDKTPAKQTGCMMFGKFKGQTYEWMIANQRPYIDWAVENVEGFKAKIKALL